MAPVKNRRRSVLASAWAVVLLSNQRRPARCLVSSEDAGAAPSRRSNRPFDTRPEASGVEPSVGSNASAWWSGVEPGPTRRGRPAPRRYFRYAPRPAAPEERQRFQRRRLRGISSVRKEDDRHRVPYRLPMSAPHFVRPTSAPEARPAARRNPVAFRCRRLSAPRSKSE